MLVHCLFKSIQMALLVSIKDSNGDMKLNTVVVETSLQVVAPVLRFFAILFAHVLLHFQQQVGISHTHCEGTSSSDDCIDNIWIYYALCWIASASVLISRLKCA